MKQASADLTCTVFFVILGPRPSGAEACDDSALCLTTDLKRLAP